MISKRVLFGFLLIILILPLMGSSCEEEEDHPPIQSPLPNIASHAAGKFHEIRSLSNFDSVVQARGEKNDFGQLGLGHNNPIPGDEVKDWKTIPNCYDYYGLSIGDYHSLAVHHGTVIAWGKNDKGQLGIGSFDTNPHSQPQVLTLHYIDLTAAGPNHSLALATDGKVWAWGLNDNNQLGDGSDQNQAWPVQSQRPWDPFFVPTAAAVTPGAGPAPRANPPKAVGLAPGDGFTLFLLDDGTVWACGKNDRGQLGDGSGAPRPIPVRVPGLTGVVGLKAGDDHALALKNDGSLWSWGGNGNGQVGDGSNTNRLAPVRVLAAGGAALSGVLAIAAGSGFSAALVNGGTVWAWGGNSRGQLGNGTADPQSYATQVPSLSGVKGLNAQASSIWATRGDGWPLAWGANSFGQVGDGTTQDRYTPTPMSPQAQGLALGKVLATGANHFLVLQSSGQALSWGDNSYGQLGSGDTQNRVLPGPLVDWFTRPLVSLAAGYKHSLAVGTDGTVWAWGDNSQGQLGINIPGGFMSEPVAVGAGSPTATAVATRGSHCLALAGDGKVWGWGCNTSGQLGNGPTSLIKPLQISGLPSVKAIAAGSKAGGSGHSLALGSDGLVYAWGLNDKGQLGDGTTTDRPNPAPVGGLAGMAAIAAGGDYQGASGGNNFSLALGNDGKVYTWGCNASGQLGDGTTTDRHTPVQVVNLDNVAAIGAGSFHSLALKSDGSVWAWGENAAGALGARLPGGSSYTSTPVQVGVSNAAAIIADSAHSLALDNSGNLWFWGTSNFGSSSSPTQVLDSGGSGPLSLLMPVPVATAPTGVTHTGFTAHWNALTGATAYYLDVATDAGFSQFVYGYKNTSVGNATQRPVTGLNPKIPYYYRVRAKVADGITPSSNTVVRFPVAVGRDASQALLLLLKD